MKRIAIIPNETKDIGLDVTKKVIACLKGRAELLAEDKFAAEKLDVTYMSEGIFEAAEIVIVIGGDGTVLQVAEPCASREIPVMGINMGRIGFMTEIETDEIKSACERLLAGDFKCESRMMMNIKIIKGEREINCCSALNDVVLTKTDAKMIAVELYASENKINEYMADGIIISTPTGSTGYSLSAGGPVADPAMEIFIASPICAHMLGSRPAVMPADKNIVLEMAEGSATVTVDGVICEEIGKGDKIIVSKAKHSFKLIKMTGYSFYDVLINKLS